MDERHIDTEKALEKLGKSNKLLKILLIGFIVKHTRIDEEIKNLSDRGDFKDAQRIAHSIKGLSGNLGAEGLKEAAYILEKTYENYPNAYDQAIQSFKNELELVIEEIKEMLKEMEAANDEVAVTIEVDMPMDINGISQLVDALDSFHYERIIKAYHIFKQYEFPEEAGIMPIEISNLIDNYDYNGAKKVLLELLDEMKAI